MIFPLLSAFILAVTKNETIRGITVRVSVCALAVASLVLTTQCFGKTSKYYLVNSEIIGYVMLAIEFIVAIYIIYLGIKHKKYSFLSYLLPRLQLCSSSS